MKKPRRQQTNETRSMSTMGRDPVSIGIPQLTEIQTGFEAQLGAAGRINEAIAKLDQATSASRSERILKFARDLVGPPSATAPITELAKTASRDLKVIDDKAKESRDALVSVGHYLGIQISEFEGQNCADALAVYRKELAEFRQSNSQKDEIEAKIRQLIERCDEQQSAV